MNSGNEKTKSPAHPGGVLFIFFLLVLWLPTLETILKFDTTPTTNENRDPARFPDWPKSPGNLQKFLGGLEIYFNDHFGCRKYLVRAHNRWLTRWFHEASHPDVIRGTDDWLYFAGGKMINSYHLGELLPPERLLAWQKLFESRRDWLARWGIQYLVIIGPDKHSIYPEHLPAWITKSSKPTMFDQFLAQMKNNSTVEVLDFRAQLIAGKTNQPTYFSTDSHWTPYGAFLGYAETMRAISAKISGLTPLRLADFSQRRVEHQPGGDAALLLGIQNSIEEESFTDLVPKSPLAFPPVVILNPASPHDDWLRHTEFPGGKGKLMFYEDSFGERMINYFGETFHETLFVNKHWLLPTLIETEKPDIVIDEFVEREINSRDPVELMKKDNLP